MNKENCGSDGPPKCSACFRSENEVKALTAAPGYRLCDECVEICEQIVAELEKGFESPSVPGLSGQR